MLVTCEYVPSTFASSIEVHLPSAEPVQENAALKSFKKAVSKACKQKFQQHGIPVAEKRFKVNVPLGGSWGSLPTQPIRVTGASNKARAHALRTIPVFSTKSCSETCFVTLQEGMSPVKQVLQENHVKPAAPSGSAPEVPAWFATYKQQTDQKFAEQKDINTQQATEIEQQAKEIEQQAKEIEQQAQDIKRLSRTVRGYEDIEVRKLKESGRCKILAALSIRQTPRHWNTSVRDLSSKHQAILRANKISHQAVLATSYDHFQKQGNEAAHDPVAEVVANAVMALPQAEKVRFVELFDVVFGDGVYESIVQGWTVQA